MSVERQRTRQRVWDGFLGATMLLACLCTGGALVVGVAAAVPLVLLLLIIAVLAAGAVCRRPVLAVYGLVLAALLLEQFPIEGLDPFTARTHAYQAVSGFSPLPLPVSPVELLIALGLATVVLPAMAHPGDALHWGSLFGPLAIFLAAVFSACVRGYVGGAESTSFNPDAAWDEIRSFLYLASAYLLACNLITERRRLVLLLRLVIAAIGLKGVQGSYNFLVERRLGLELEALTGHEDVLFFAFFFLLFAAFCAYAVQERQRRVMLWLLPPIVFAELATGRRIAFFVLATGLLVIGLALLRTRTNLFLKIAPLTLLLCATYGVLFWDSKGIVAEPLRAVKSQTGYTTERDRRSDLWRDLENMNIAHNIRSAPLLGLGFGRPYEFAVAQPSLDLSGFVYWTYITHNAIFWIWMKMGALGFVAFWYLFGSALVQALVTFRRLSDGYLRAIALAIGGLVVMQLVFSYGDLGLTYARTMIFLGCMLGVLVRLPTIAAADCRQGDTMVALGKRP